MGWPSSNPLKTPEIVTCNQRAEHFTNRVFNKYSSSDELRLIFDRYDLPMPLKQGTRTQRKGRSKILSYNQFNAYCQHQDEATTHTFQDKARVNIVSNESLENVLKGTDGALLSHGECECAATHQFMQRTEHRQSEQEGVDTKVILHTFDATANSATELNIYSPDTDVFIRRYPDLCQNTIFVTAATEQRHRRIDLKSIFQVLGPTKAAALPSFHAFSGADNTGSFFLGKGRLHARRHSLMLIKSS